MGSIPGSGRSIGEEHGNPLQYSCLEHPIDRGAWWARVHRVANSWTRLKQLSTHKCMQSVFSYTPSRASAVIKGRTGDFLKAQRAPTPGSLEDHVSVTVSPSLNGTEKTLYGCWVDGRIPGDVALLWGWWYLPLGHWCPFFCLFCMSSFLLFLQSDQFINGEWEGKGRR